MMHSRLKSFKNLNFSRSSFVRTLVLLNSKSERWDNWANTGEWTKTQRIFGRAPGRWYLFPRLDRLDSASERHLAFFCLFSREEQDENTSSYWGKKKKVQGDFLDEKHSIIIKVLSQLSYSILLLFCQKSLFGDTKDMWLCSDMITLFSFSLLTVSPNMTKTHIKLKMRGNCKMQIHLQNTNLVMSIKKKKIHQ